MILINYVISNNMINKFDELEQGKDRKLLINYEKLLIPNERNNLNGDAIISKLLPQKKKQVFISHSHLDIELVKKIAKDIEEKTGLSCFIDSNVWGNVDVLQNKWDLKCKGNRDFFNRGEILDNSTNTRMMLATSLLQAINDCEYFLFINTENSGEIIDAKEINVKSPWIFFELKSAILLHNKEKAKTQGRIALNDSY